MSNNNNNSEEFEQAEEIIDSQPEYGYEEDEGDEEDVKNKHSSVFELEEIKEDVEKEEIDKNIIELNLSNMNPNKMSLEQQKKMNETFFTASIECIDLSTKLLKLEDDMEKMKKKIHRKYNPLFIISIIEEYISKENDNNKKKEYSLVLSELQKIDSEYNDSINFYYYVCNEFKDLKENDRDKISEYVMINKFCIDTYWDNKNKLYNIETITIENIKRNNDTSIILLNEIKRSLCVSAYKIALYNPLFEEQEIYKKNVNKDKCLETMLDIESGKLKQSEDITGESFIRKFYRKIMEKVLKYTKIYSSNLTSKLLYHMKAKMIENCVKIANTTLFIGFAKQAAFDVGLGIYNVYQGKSFNIYNDYLYKGDNIIQTETILLIRLIQILAITFCKSLTNQYITWNCIKLITKKIINLFNEFTPFPYSEIGYGILRKAANCICTTFAYYSPHFINSYFISIVYSQFTFICGTLVKMMVDPRKVIENLAVDFGDTFSEMIIQLNDTILGKIKTINLSVQTNVNKFFDGVKEQTYKVIDAGFDKIKEVLSTKFKKNFGYLPSQLNPVNLIADMSVSEMLLASKNVNSKLITNTISDIAITGGSISAGKIIAENLKGLTEDSGDVELEIEESDEIENEIDDITDEIVDEVNKKSKETGKEKVDILENNEDIINKVEKLVGDFAKNKIKETNDILTNAYNEVKKRKGKDIEESFQKVADLSIEILSKKITKEINRDTKEKLTGKDEKVEYIGYDKKRKREEDESEKEEKESESDKATRMLILQLLIWAKKSLIYIKEATIDELFNMIKNQSLRIINYSYEQTINMLRNKISNITNSLNSCKTTLATMNINLIFNKLNSICNSVNDVFNYFMMSWNMLDYADEICSDILEDYKMQSFGATTTINNFILGKVKYYYQRRKVLPALKETEQKTIEKMSTEDKEFIEKFRENIKKRKLQ
jgi:hypothetical protein